MGDGSESYLHEDAGIFYVIKKSCEIKSGFSESELSSLIVKLADQKCLLTNVVEGLNGLGTPYLNYILTGYLMTHIITGSDPFYLTGEGLHYINGKINSLDSIIKSVIDETVAGYFKSKNH